MQVDGCHVRYASLCELREECARDPEAWLSVEERSELALQNDERRRLSWLAGRRLAKRLIRETTATFVALRDIAILSRNERGKADRPVVCIDGAVCHRSLSISHSDVGALVALARSDAVEIGADLTPADPPTRGFLATWFTGGEQQQLQNLPADEPAVFWAIKEAVYKACQRGESFQPRKIEVFRCGRAEYRCKYGESDQPLRTISVNRIDGQIAVVAMTDRMKSAIRRSWIRKNSDEMGVRSDSSEFLRIQRQSREVR